MVSRIWCVLGALLALVAPLFLTGCNNAPPTEKSEVAGHEHGHGGEGEKLGPNGGHMLEFTQGPYAAEWLHDDDTDTVTVFLLDSEGNQEQPLPIEQVIIEVAYSGLEPDEYVLPAVTEEGAEPAAENAQFQLSDAQLMTALKMESEVVNLLKLEIDGETYSAKIVHHDHSHGHSHSHD